MEDFIIADDDRPTIQPIQYRAEMIFMSSELLTIKWKKPMPNWWWRLWQYLMFGIKWRNIDDTNK